ncbi:MAG: hypothetical protein AABX17_00155 [Nanoarchaeota archaeon]
MEKRNKIYLFVGIYFALLGLAYLVHMFRTESYVGLFWSCNIAPILFSIGFLTENMRLIKGTINYIFLPNLVFMICTIIYFTTSISLVRIDIAFDTIPNGIMGVWIHLLSANVALFYTRKIKPDKHSLIYAATIFLIIFIFTLILAPESQNVNFLQSTKPILGFDIPFFTILWPLFVFFVLIIPTYLSQIALAKKKSSLFRLPQRDKIFKE